MLDFFFLEEASTAALSLFDMLVRDNDNKTRRLRRVKKPG